jgi:hypothetical protein
MWMTTYIREIKIRFRDVYHFIPDRIQDGEPCFDNIPNGTYPMEIAGKTDWVKIEGGRIHCCNFEPPAEKELP